jgi:hypothetical protein
MKSREGMIYSPIVHTLVGLVLGLAGMAMMSRESAVAVFAVTTIYALASPILIALRRWWFVNAFLCLVGMIVLLLIMPVVGVMMAGRDTLGETQMLLMLPAMIFPCALVASGVMRFLVVRKERASAA